MPKQSNAWVFVSHSTKDLDKVRDVRNALEGAGAEPILFFLKCVSETDELDDLLKREIDARNFFLLCDSAHAKSSKWVQEEVAYVNGLQGKKIEVIDLDGDWQAQLNGISRLVREARLFLSFSTAHDGDLANGVSDRLMRADFAVHRQDSFAVSAEDIGTRLRRMISETLESGYFVHFLSSHSLKSQWGRFESEVALEIDPRRYIPVLVQPLAEIQEMLPPQIAQIQLIDGTDRDPNTIADQITSAILTKG